MIIEAIPTFQDNYVWAIHNGTSAILVDPGETAPILTWLRRHNRVLQGILVTHHHNDHVGGIAELLEQHPVPVYGPTRRAAESIAVSDGDTLTFDNIPLKLKVIETPGHTRDHVCYVGQETDNSATHLFCGDTVFSCGCGRLFEGTAAQMYDSLIRLAQLPADTLLYCAHEYTLENIAFALLVEPDNPALQAWHAQALNMLKSGKPTLPVSMRHECATNPFFRCDLNSLAVAASQHFNQPLKPGGETFAAIRAWRDAF